MYAIIEVAGKQYNVKEGDLIQVEKQELLKGDKLAVKDVLLISDDDQVKIGQPVIKGASITAEVVRQLKDKKAISFKYRRRKSSDWKKGHRQQLTELRITKITAA